MKYADPNCCPQCRGPIGGVTRCATCGFDLSSPAAQELWNLFIRADAVIDQARSSVMAPAPSPATAATLGTADEPAQAPVTSGPPPVPAAQVQPARPRMNFTPGSVLLGLGALSLVVAATIFVSLTWGSLGIAGRAAILLAITFAFGAGLWFALKRTLPATSEALAFVVLAMVSINVSAAVYEGLFSLDQVHWGYPVVTWALLIAGISYLVQPFSFREIGRRLYVVETGLGISSLAGAIGVSSFVWEFLPEQAHWSLLAGLPLIGVYLWFALISDQKLTKCLAYAWAALWTLAMTLWAWIAIIDNYLTLNFNWVGPTLVVIGLGITLGMVRPRTRVLAYPYSVSNVAFVLGMLLIWLLDRHSPANGVTLALAFFSLFLAVHVAADYLIPETSTVLRWANPALAFVLLVTWTFPVTTFLSGGDIHADTERIRSEELSTFWLAGALIVATALLAAYLWQFSEKTFVHATPWLATGLKALAIGISSLGQAAFVSYLHAPGLLSVILMLAGVLAIVWVCDRSPYWQLSGIVLPLLSLTVIEEASWAFLVSLAVLAFCAGFSARWINMKSAGSEDLARATGTVSYSALATWSVIYGIWHLPTIVGSGFADTDLYLVLITSGVLVVALGVQTTRHIRIGVELAATFLALVSLIQLLEKPATFAFAALALAAACFIVGVTDTERRWQFLPGLVLGVAAWIAQLVAWDIEVVEAYTAPIAVVLLVLGLVAMHQYRELSTTYALGAGLAVAFIPSLWGVLEEPASTRALVWGAVAALVLGAGLFLKWLAPVLAGAAALVVVLLANVGPIFMDLDRWIIFGVLGATLLAIGIRWEQNVVDGKALLMKLAHLR